MIAATILILLVVFPDTFFIRESRIKICSIGPLHGVKRDFYRIEKCRIRELAKRAKIQVWVHIQNADFIIIKFNENMIITGS